MKKRWNLTYYSERTEGQRQLCLYLRLWSVLEKRVFLLRPDFSEQGIHGIEN